MTYNVSLTESAIFAALRAFILDALGTVEVVQGADNRVPPPCSGPYVSMIRVGQTRLSTNQVVNTDNYPTSQTITETQPTRVSIQLDCYGAAAGDWANLLATAFRSDLGCAFFEPFGIDPLYHDEPKSLPLVNGEEQYERRWMLVVHLQANIAITATAQFMTAAKITTVNVSTIH